MAAYRSTLRGVTHSFPDLRTLLTKARTALDTLPDTGAAVGKLSAQVSSLLLDVEKRQLATGG